MGERCPMCGYCAEARGTDEAKLPRKYAKAYRFMLANLREPDLTVSDLAQAAGVTERGLQLAWKQHLQCCPGDTLRRLRAEKIRHEILTSNRTIMQCAEKWGVFNRSTLCHLFRAVFNYEPSALRGPAAQPLVGREQSDA